MDYIKTDRPMQLSTSPVRFPSLSVSTFIVSEEKSAGWPLAALWSKTILKCVFSLHEIHRLRSLSTRARLCERT